MGDIFVSLGSGCAVSQRLNEAGLRKQSYPFDWLWNFEGGLEVVIDIINDNFHQFTDRANLVEEWHYRWDKKVMTNKYYPNIAHIHSDPLNNDKDYQSLLRRVKKFKDLLNGQSNIQFIYFRSIEEFDPSTKHEEYNLAFCFERLLKESNEFIKLIQSKYPSSKFNLISICMLPYEQAIKEKLLIENFRKQNNEHLELEIVYSDNETKTMKSFFSNLTAYNSWIKIFYKKKHIGIYRFFYCSIQFSFKKILNH